MNFKFKAGLITFVAIGLTASAHGASVPFTTVTSNGTVPGTDITYTISDPAATVEALFAPGESNSQTWSWDNNFPEFIAVGGQTLSVTFSSPVALNLFVFGANSLSTSATLSVSGGTAETSDFDLFDGADSLGNTGGLLSYDGDTGVFTADGGNQGLIIGSTSTDTISSFTFTANGGGDGYGLFFGTLDAADTPEPASFGLFTAALAVLCGANRIRKRK